MTKHQWIDLFEKTGLTVIDFFPKQSKMYCSIYNYEKHGYMRWVHMHKMDDGRYYVKLLFWQTEVLGELHEEEDTLDDEEYILRVIAGFLDEPVKVLEICKEEEHEEKEEKWEQMSLF